MPRVYVEFAGLKEVGNDCRTVSTRVGSIRSEFKNTVSKLDWDVKYKSDINSTANQIARKLEQYEIALRKYQSFLDEAYSEYVKLDEFKQLNIKDSINLSVLPIDIDRFRPLGPGSNTYDIMENFWDHFFDEFGWSELLSGAGYIGQVYNLISDIKDCKSWADAGKSGKDIYDFVTKAAKTYNNYKKIGNAVGTQKAMTWWAKNITGLKPLGRASTAKNPVTRFANNLTNKTSPFNAQLKDVLKDFKGKNGVGKAVASWGSVLVSGVTNAFGNIEEQKNSNGAMSTGRVVAETITETAIDIALTYGATAVAGAAVTAALGTVAAPGVVVVAASGLLVAGVNAGVKALTGKTTTEWISDAVLDTGEKIGKAVSSAAKNVKESVGRWFGKIAFA